MHQTSKYINNPQLSVIMTESRSTPDINKAYNLTICA